MMVVDDGVLESLRSTIRCRDSSACLDAMLGLYREFGLRNLESIPRTRAGALAMLAEVHYGLVVNGFLAADVGSMAVHFACEALDTMSDGLIEALLQDTLEVEVESDCC